MHVNTQHVIGYHCTTHDSYPLYRIWSKPIEHWHGRLNLQCCHFCWSNTLSLYLIAWIRGNPSGSVSSSQTARQISPLGSVILIKLMRREKFFSMMRKVASVDIFSVGIMLTSTAILNGIRSCRLWMEAMAILPGYPSSKKRMVPCEPGSLLSAFIAGFQWSGDRRFQNKILKIAAKLISHKTIQNGHTSCTPLNSRHSNLHREPQSGMDTIKRMQEQPKCIGYSKVNTHEAIPKQNRVIAPSWK